MKFNLIVLIILLSNTLSLAQKESRFSKHEISINGFRNPSIGLEYRYKFISFHAGYYLTNLETNTTWEFLKAGATLWFLPIGKRENPSSFYAQFSYLRGQNRDYQDENAGSVDVGFRWMIWKGLQIRIGAIALFAPDKDVKINPTPGISYSFFIK